MSNNEYITSVELEERLRALREPSAAEQFSTAGKFIRKAGPAIGATVGAGVGALFPRASRQGIGRFGHALEGAGTGSLIGWAPGFYADAADAVREVRANKVRGQEKLAHSWFVEVVKSKLTGSG